MVSLPRILTPHTVLIEDKTGDGAYGPVHATAREVRRCRVEDKRTLVRDEHGQEVVSTSRVFLRPDAGPVPAGSRVTLWPGRPHERTATVITAALHHTPPAPEHHELALT